MDEGVQAPGPRAEAPRRVSLRDWLRAGARVLMLRAPSWDGLVARPLTLVTLIAADYLIGVCAQWLLTEGSPFFLWRGLLSGWAGFVLTLWLCWIVARSAAAPAGPAASTATLITLLCSAGLVFSFIDAGFAVASSDVFGRLDDWPEAARWLVWVLPLAWIGLAQARLLWRVAGTGAARAAIALLTPLPLLISGWLAPTSFWWSPPAKAEAEADVGLKLTEEVLSRQPLLLESALDALRPPQSGRVNVYAATYAPYASEDVFMRESAVVAKAMRERFGAEGRIVELVMNPATTGTLPWAMPGNLHKTIQRMAAVMDRDRDVLFLHLTSHGGADGKLAKDSWPLETETLTPQLLKRWLDEAGVRWRVISVSACYSGTWIAPLAGDGTLVMTAADAEHTSYGCGRRSPLTFFGQAMYVDALRETHSFEAAHARARALIEKREQEAGKTDGYSNPQLSQGAGIRRVLQRLQDELGG